MAYPPQPTQPQPHEPGPWDGGAQGRGYGPGQGYGPPPGQGAPPQQGYGPAQGYGPPQNHGQPQGYGPPQGPHQSPHQTPPQGPLQSPPQGPRQSPPQGYGGQPQNYGPPQGQGPTQPGQGPFAPTGYPPKPPAKKNTGLIVGLAAGLTVLVVGGGAAAYAYLSAPGPAPTVALPSTSPSTSSPSESASPPQAPTTAPPQSTPPESTSPTNTQPTSTPAQSGTPITHNEFDDWTFTQGGVKFEADKVAGWTYSSCKGLDSQGVLVKNRCQRAVQLAYSAYGGHLKAVQLVMSFPNDQAAKITADRLATLSSNAVKWRQDKALPSYAYGKILSGSAKRYVVMTIVTADKSARTKAPNFHAYLQTDRATSILSRGQTLTS